MAALMVASVGFCRLDTLKPLPLTPAQSRAARGLLNWDVDRLATFTGIKVSDIRAFETEHPVSHAVVAMIRKGLERAGIDFMDGGAPGVRWRPEPRTLRIEQLNASNDE
jgi:hypothetical protein